MNKIEELIQIMFEEDEYRKENGMELMYHTEEELEEEKINQKEISKED